MEENKKVSDEQVQEMIDYLNGTILSVPAACEAFGFEDNEMTMSQLVMLDEQIFCCSQCGWWHEIAERHEFDDEPYCDDCIEDVTREDEEDY